MIVGLNYGKLCIEHPVFKLSFKKPDQKDQLSFNVQMSLNSYISNGILTYFLVGHNLLVFINNIRDRSFCTLHYQISSSIEHVLDKTLFSEEFTA